MRTPQAISSRRAQGSLQQLAMVTRWVEPSDSPLFLLAVVGLYVHLSPSLLTQAKAIACEAWPLMLGIDAFLINLVCALVSVV